MKRETLRILAGGIALVLASAAAFNSGRGAHARVEQAEAAASEEEARVFCRGLGFAPESAAFAQCTNGLREIRQRQRKRRESDAAGML